MHPVSQLSRCFSKAQLIRFPRSSFSYFFSKIPVISFKEYLTCFMQTKLGKQWLKYWSYWTKVILFDYVGGRSVEVVNNEASNHSTDWNGIWRALASHKWSREIWQTGHSHFFVVEERMMLWTWWNIHSEMLQAKLCGLTEMKKQLQPTEFSRFVYCNKSVSSPLSTHRGASERVLWILIYWLH